MHIERSLALVAVLVSSVARVAAEDAAPPAEQPACLATSQEARYKGLGYDHVVIIDNACRDAYHCAVSTNVNPRVIEVEVPVKSRREVVTFRGSPAREFVANIACVKTKT